MDKLTTAQLLAGYAPVVGGVALAAMSTTLAMRYQADLVNVSLAMFGGFVGGVAVVGAALSEIAYHWPRPIVSPVVSPPDTKPVPPGYNTFSQTANGLIDLQPELPPYFNFRVARRVAWAVTRRGEPLTQARLAQVMSKGNAARLMAWMLEQRLIKWRGVDRRAGVVVTGAGMDWLENILRAFGPPPIKAG